MESRKVIVLMVCLACMPFAQCKWERIFGGSDRDQAFSVTLTPDGGYVAAGLTSSFPQKCYEMYIVKTDAQGDPVWMHNYGTAFNDYCWSIAPAHDSGYVLLGATDSTLQTGPHDVYLVRIGENGDSLWSRVYGDTGSGLYTDDVGHKIEPTADGGYIIVGSTESYGAGSYDVYLIKINAAGDTQWTQTYGTVNYETGKSVKQTDDGGYVVAGTTIESGLGQQIWILRTDASGDTIWAGTYGGPDAEDVTDILQAEDMGFVFIGSSAGDLYLAKIDSLGSVDWSKTYGYQYSDWGNALAQTDDGGMIIIGGNRTAVDPEYCNAWLLKVDQNGDTLWTRMKTSEIGSANGMDVQQAVDGGYIIAAITWSYGGEDDIFLVKTDDEGISVLEEMSHRNRVDQNWQPLVYPNPFVLFITVQGHETGIYDVYSSTGRLVGSYTGREIGANLNSGVYFLSPRDHDHDPVRIIKVK